MAPFATTERYLYVCLRIHKVKLFSQMIEYIYADINARLNSLSIILGNENLFLSSWSYFMFRVRNTMYRFNVLITNQIRVGIFHS